MLLIHREVQQGEEEVAVASARLARRLHLDPVVRIHPARAADRADHADRREHSRRGPGPRGAPEPARDRRSLRRGRRRGDALPAGALRPLLPTLWLGFSGGGFGGGSNLVPPLLGNFGGRTDFDVRAYWTLQNLGLGNLALWRQRRAEVGVAMGEQSRTINQVRREVSAALADATAARGQIDVTARQLATAKRGFREDLDRIRGTIGLPIEVENSLDLLAEARQNHLRAIIDYNRRSSGSSWRWARRRPWTARRPARFPRLRSPRLPCRSQRSPRSLRDLDATRI